MANIIKLLNAGSKLGIGRPLVHALSVNACDIASKFNKDDATFTKDIHCNVHGHLTKVNHILQAPTFELTELHQVASHLQPIVGDIVNTSVHLTDSAMQVMYNGEVTPKQQINCETTWTAVIATTDDTIVNTALQPSPPNLSPTTLNNMCYQKWYLRSGDILVFGGYVPHFYNDPICTSPRVLLQLTYEPLWHPHSRCSTMEAAADLSKFVEHMANVA